MTGIQATYLRKLMKYMLTPLLYLSITYGMDESNIIFSKELKEKSVHYSQQLSQAKDYNECLRALIEKEEHHFIESAIDNARLKHTRTPNTEDFLNKMKSNENACALHANLLYRLRRLQKEEREPLYNVIKKNETEDHRLQHDEQEKASIKRNLIETAINILRLEHELSKSNETHSIVTTFISQIKKDYKDYKEEVSYIKFFHKENLQHIDPKERISQLTSSYSLIGEENITLSIKGTLPHHEPYDNTIGDRMNSTYKEHYWKEHVQLFVNTHLKCEKINSLVDYKEKTTQYNFTLAYAPGYKEDCTNALKRHKRDLGLQANLLYRLSEAQDQPQAQKNKRVFDFLIKESEERKHKKLKKSEENGESKSLQEN